MTIIQRRSAAIHEAESLLSYQTTLPEFYFVFGHMFSSKTLMNADKMQYTILMFEIPAVCMSQP
jgi:hypothetical protein